MSVNAAVSVSQYIIVWVRIMSVKAAVSISQYTDCLGGGHVCQGCCLCQSIYCLSGWESCLSMLLSLSVNILIVRVRFMSVKAVVSVSQYIDCLGGTHVCQGCFLCQSIYRLSGWDSCLSRLLSLSVNILIVWVGVMSVKAAVSVSQYTDCLGRSHVCQCCCL